MIHVDVEGAVVFLKGINKGPDIAAAIHEATEEPVDWGEWTFVAVSDERYEIKISAGLPFRPPDN